MSTQKRHAGNLKLLGGGAVCLDFINTVDWRGTESPVEFLNTPHDLIVWSRHAGTLSGDEANHLAPRFSLAAPDVRSVFVKALELRENLYRIFSVIADGDRVESRELEKFNAVLSHAMAHIILIPNKNGFSWDFNRDRESPDRILFPVIRSAADLLVSDQLGRVRKCADPRCGWLFLDTSRNRSRRWCDMRDCGNRAKASRFYRRRQNA